MQATAPPICVHPCNVGELEPLDAHFDRLWRNGTDARNAQILLGLEEAVRLEARRCGESGEVVFRALVPHEDVPVPAALYGGRAL